MGVSFKISKVGSRFKPKLVISETNVENSVESSQAKSKKDESNTFTTTSARKLDGRGDNAAGFSGSSLSSRTLLISSEDEVSFALNLYPDGYSIGKPSESEDLHNAVLQDGAKLLHSYDRTSESLFSAIESGQLPGILEDMPCRYKDGQIICEVRDYRRCIVDSGSNAPSTDKSPAITKVQLKMSLENVVKDIPLIADDSWTYGDLMEVESRILKALQPKLCLDPSPRLDRLNDSSLSSKLNLGLSGLRKRRLRQIPDVNITFLNKPHAKKIRMGPFSESSTSRLGESGAVSADILSPQAHTQNVCSDNVLPTRSRGFVHDNSIQAMNVPSPESEFQLRIRSQRLTPDSILGTALNTSGVSPASQDMTTGHMDKMNSNNLLPAKMGSEEGQLSSSSSLNKRAMAGQFGPEGSLQLQMGTYMESLQASDVQWRNPLVRQQGNATGLHFSNTGIQKYAQMMPDGTPNQDGMTSIQMGQKKMKYGVSGERFETQKFDNPGVQHGRNNMQTFKTENNHMDPRILQRLPTHNSFMRPGGPGLNPGGWNNIGQVDKEPRKEDLIERRKSIQSPQASAGSGAQFSLLAKSTDLSCDSLVNQYAAVSSAATLGSSHREKAGVPSVPAGGRTQSVSSSGNDSVQQQHQSRVSARRRSNSLPKTPYMSGVGSPASVSNVSFPMNAASPSVGTPPLADQTMLERFSKIDMVTMRRHLNAKKGKVDDYSRKCSIFSAQELRACLSISANNESIADDSCTMTMSKTLIGGNINIPKIRVLTVKQAEHTLQGDPVPVAPHRVKTRMIMSQKVSDGTIAMHHGDLDDDDYLDAENHLPTLPNTYYADLVAAEFHRLMAREGYHVEDHVQLRPRTSVPSSTQPSVPRVGPSNPAVGMQQHAEAHTNGCNPTISGNTLVNLTPNLQPSAGMLPSGSPQTPQMSQGLLDGVSMPARSQQPHPQQGRQQQKSPLQTQPSIIQQQQQQQSQFQRSLMMPPISLSSMNSFGQSSNLQLGNQMMNKPSLQVLQQQQSPQLQSPMQQPQMQRKMMMGLGTAVGMGNMGNNMVGLGGLGIGGARGIGGTGLSAPMGPIAGMGNMGQNPMGINQASNISNALSQHLRSGTLTEAQAAMLASRMSMPQNRGIMGGPQSSVASMAGARQPACTGLSMLGQTMNRGNTSPMHQMPLGSMAAPKVMSGMNVHMTPQQKQYQQQLQLQLQHQQLQLQRQQLHQPPPASPQLQQETSSLQAVVSSPQVSSPSTLVNHQPPNYQPTALQQQVSPQINLGAMHPMSAVNPGAGPGSPQVSSPTLGSVGNVANSPMDLGGANKSSSVGNI